MIPVNQCRIVRRRVRRYAPRVIDQAPFARRSQLVLMAVVIAVAVALRLDHAARSLAFDEMASLYFSGQSWAHLWGWWMLRETNPPLFYSLLKLWRATVPMGHWAMRALPLGVWLITAGVFARWLWARLGGSAALLGLAVMAVSASDIYQADYLRGYGLARLAVLIGFVALVDALDGVRARRNWAIYVVSAVVAIHCHTTMVLWPVIATLAVLADAAMTRTWCWPVLIRLIVADAVTAVLSGWVLVMAWAQMRSHSADNITWLAPLGWQDFAVTCNLQLLTGGVIGSVLMALAMAIGLWRGRRVRAVRLAAAIALGAVVLFKAADRIHPIVSDFTLHWAFSFTALVAAAALAPPMLRWQRWIVPGAVVAVLAGGLVDVMLLEPPFVPQDWRQTVRTVAADPGAALLADHESIGVIVEQGCLVEFGSTHCPFALVVLADPRLTDNWAFGGYHGPLLDPAGARAVLRGARRVYAFSRYYYTPLEHLGLRPKGLAQVYWDDGELIGPIAPQAFAAPAPYPIDPDAQYTGAPDPDEDAD